MVGEQLAQFLGVDTEIKTVDCFDISHFQSRFLVGSCVRFTGGLPEKNKFRRFKIKTLDVQNDYAALQEIVSRRYREGDIPDLVLIDGGKGQLSAVTTIIPQAHCISIAKREETIYSNAWRQGRVLDVHDPVAKLLISLRDYAHHFAVSYHKVRRKKIISPLKCIFHHLLHMFSIQRSMNYFFKATSIQWSINCERD